MKYFIAALIFSVAASSAELFSWIRHGPQSVKNFSVDNSNRIVNGKVAAPGQFPHQVLLILQIGTKVGMCGGSIICDSWVLTAAHCTRGAQAATILFGSVEFGKGRVIQKSTEIYVHPEHNTCNKHNDISLIRFPEKLVYNEFIQPIPLNTNYITGQNPLTISGWGDIRKCGPDLTPSFLNFAEMDTISNEECKETIPSIVISNETLCVKGRMKESGCHGDSGGPLIQYRDGKAVQVAINSFIVLTCDNGFPMASVRVSSYIDWIVKTINGTCQLVQ